jgi:hypothetical protein
MTKKFTSSRKAAYLEQFHQSGLTQTTFCKQQGLVFKTFNKWLKDSRARLVHSQQAMTHFKNGAVTTTKQATFIPIHLNNAAFCEPSPPEPPESDCRGTSSKSAFHQSVLGFKTNRFSLDIPLDLATDYGQAALKNLIQILHQLPGGQNMYD